MIHRHVTEGLRALALDYVLGFLPVADAAAVAAHLEAECEVCAREVRANRYLVDLLLAQQAWEEPSAGLRDRLLTLIESEIGEQSRPGPDIGFCAIPDGWAIVRSGREGWKAGEGRATALKQLSHNDADGSRVMLVRVEAGGLYSGFRAAGTVELYVVEGDLLVNSERLCTGDYCAAPTGTLLNDMESRSGCEFILVKPDREVETEEEIGAASFSVMFLRASDGSWLTTSAPGVTVKPLFTDPARRTETYLVRAKPGSRMPRHRHVTADRTFFLEGDGRTGTMILEAGDFYRADVGTVHEASWTERGCLCITLESISEVMG